MNLEFWRNKRVFLTGHTGFKGSWLSLWLQYLGSEVTGYALSPPTTPSLFEVAKVSTGMISIISDIRDLERLTQAMHDAKPDIVIHMAAQPLVRYSYQAPVETFATNVMGTVHLLEAVRKSETVRAVVNVTSDKCYDNKEWFWGYREIEPMGGYDPYSNSKGCAELVTAAYRNSFFNSEKYNEHGVAIGSGRAGNVIGGGDWAGDRLIPDILRAIEVGQVVNIRSPHAIRPWQHVLEPLSGYLTLAEKLFNDGPEYAEGWNFGPSEEDAKNVQWIVEQITAKWSNRSSWKLEHQPQPHEANYLKLDSAKARLRLKWMTCWSIEKTISSIVEWHKKYFEGNEMQAETIKQINEYQSERISKFISESTDRNKK